MRIAMIAYTWYAFDPRVRRAAEALAERGHQVDIFAVSSRRSTFSRQSNSSPATSAVTALCRTLGCLSNCEAHRSSM